MRALEEAALVMVIAWAAVMVVAFSLAILETWTALWRRLDELARTRRRWWGPS